MNMDKDFILQQIKNYANEHGGKTPGKIAFEKSTGIKETDWSGRYWVRWSDAVAEAGLAPNVLNPSLDTDQVLRAFVFFVRELGKFPTSAEIKLKARSDKSFPAANTVQKHLGNKSKRAVLVKAYCEKIGGFDDVARICTPHINLETKTRDIAEEDTPSTGYVYLLKSGRYYKVGSTNNPDRRRYEIGLQLPEKVHHIHSIETDDPRGIEAYWHHRFKTKRLHGEWFDLTATDIRAFRRRKFM